MSAPEIHVTVDVEGNVVVTTKGYKGKACFDASRFLEEAMGHGTVLLLTPEYHALPLPNAQKVTQ